MRHSMAPLTPDQPRQRGTHRTAPPGSAREPQSNRNHVATLTANGKSVSKPVQVLQDMWLRER